jgi:hypothetical protein
MRTRLIRTLYVNESEPFSVTERVRLADGTDILAANVNLITLQIFDESMGADVPPLDINDDLANVTIFDTLQLDGLWDRDTQGYNFRHDLEALDTELFFTRGGRAYRLEYRLELEFPLDFILVPARIVVQGFRRDDTLVVAANPVP